MGFALGSASVVQVIKLMEPIETLFLTALANITILKVSHGLTLTKALSVIIIVAGTTTMLLVQKSDSGLGHQVNFWSVFFALCSGFAMASRNVVMKVLLPTVTPPHKGRHEKHMSHGWKQTAVDGLFNYISITSAAAVPATAFLIFAEIQGSSQIKDSIISTWIIKSQVGTEAIVFHGLYNIASISVLCLISAQSHSILNVGKRIVNILYVSIAFSEPIGFSGIIGLYTAAMGSILYSFGVGGVTVFRGYFYVMVIGMMISIPFLTNFEGYGFGEGEKAAWRWSPTMDDVSTGYAVWMFPFPPQAKNMKSPLSHDETLICAYSHACEAFEDHTKINLRDLTDGTYFHNYVRDHAYHKVRHMNDFPYHIQAITLVALLKSNHGNDNVCVRTLGGTKKFCNNTQFESYDPYESDELSSTNYPYTLLSDSRSEDGDHFALAPRELMGAEKFAMWGVGDIEKRFCGYFNSGEDVQSYAGAAWLPFISEIRDKLQAVRNYDGYYIGNALMEASLNTTEKDYENAHKISLVSIYSTEPGIKGMESYIKNYTESVHPFGCRSLLTEKLLKQRRIKSYFSACLTLTTNMQGAILEDQHTNPRYVANEILKPNTRRLPTPEQKTKMVFVDVTDPKVVPESAWKSENAIHLNANVQDWYPNCSKKMGRYSYSYKLLSTYANQAKVVVTSRIHVGLPAAALGIPVIFVEGGPERSNWLPGGAQRVGRVDGLLDVFHRVQRGVYGKNWTFGDLTGEVPHSDGVHLADRYRASFWNRLKKTHFYRDTSALFGMTPFQRLGQKKIETGFQEDFHFLFESRSDLGWRTNRAIEHVFYFHPNCKVVVHSNQITLTDLEIFVETGYNLVVQPYNPDSLLKEEDFPFYKLRKDKPLQGSLPLLLLRKHGGIYLSKDTLLLQKIPADLEEGLVLQENGNPSLAKFDRESKGFLSSLTSMRSKKRFETSDGLSWRVQVLSDVDTVKCMEDIKWSLPDGLKEMIAVSLHPSSYASTETIKIDTKCYQFVEKLCIFCDEIHWDFN
eukprot:CAMPEP_0172510334 /NCGR_PEP_ID=MMETSP1066-20121228/227779_1 /TAXON_ID=671091 /ORGANISM="Coscinodiscus wailesii, Strain CCMP2513" /LENGTH=1022 /DNA_ID=CAMNT_0013289245 /DNA_START=447 /DNA_END=3515 /DNA_ORIENTATION=+